MLPEALAALASAGGTALVTAMVTDSWEGTRARLARVIGRGNEAETAKAEARLDQSRMALERAATGGLDQMRTVQEAAWRTRLSDLLEQDPGAAAELRALIAEMQRQAPADTVAIEQRATASGQAQQAVLGQGAQNVTFSR